MIPFRPCNLSAQAKANIVCFNGTAGAAYAAPAVPLKQSIAAMDEQVV